MSRSLLSLLARRYAPSSPQSERLRAETARQLFPYNLEDWLTEPPSSGARRRVVVVGGGFAGLAAAASLVRQFDVQVFDARCEGQLGGRVETRRVGGRVVEAGAELIGTNHPAWAIFAKELGLHVECRVPKEDDYKGLDVPLHLGGKDRTSEARRIFEAMERVFRDLAKEARRILDGLHDPSKVYEPWTVEGAPQLDEASLADWVSKQPVDEIIRLAINAQLGNDHAASLDQQSYLGVLAQVAGGGLGSEDPFDHFLCTENRRCQEGNAALGQKLCGFIRRSHGSITPEAPVRRVEVKEDRVIAFIGDNQQVDADYVVLAVPPTALGRGGGLRLMPRPHRRWRISTGEAVKYVSPALYEFWREHGRTPLGVGDECGLLWDATDNRKPTATECPSVLTLFAGGQAARDARAAPNVDAFYEEKIAALHPNYVEGVVDREHRDFVNWPSTPWINCGYSCPAPGEVVTAAKFLASAYRGRVLFAGEHTCMPFFGYMEGALQSGCRAAMYVREREL